MKPDLLDTDLPEAGGDFSDTDSVAPLRRVEKKAEETGGSFQEVFVQLARESGLKWVEDWKVDEERLGEIPLRLIHAYGCLPIVRSGPGMAPGSRSVEMVAGWPPDAHASQWVLAASGLVPRWHLADPRVLETEIQRRFGVGSSSLDDLAASDISAEVEPEDEEDEEAAVVRFVNEVILQALEDRATDVHFEPYRDSLRIRYRIDGVLVPVAVPSNLSQFHDSIISRIKIMARLNISERRRPQDGRIGFRWKGRDVDIRLSTFPTIYGESVSLRLLDLKSQNLTIRDLGLLEREEKLVNRTLALPHGIVLATGPTGSGKSTSLNAFLRLIQTEERRILTVEDPVEYEMEGINQTQVKEEVGLDFASALRHILRQDPDVIMIGEIRDRETADIAVRASLTGHLVFSTLHTNDAAGAITRLIDMGIEPFLIASSIELIIAQRLVRRLCPKCCTPADSDLRMLARFARLIEIPLSVVEEASASIYQAGGCDYCRGLGFRGRVGVYELLKTSEKIHDGILAGVSSRELRQIAVSEGMRTLGRSAWEHILNRRTTVPEAMQVIESLVSEETAAGPMSPTDEGG